MFALSKIYFHITHRLCRVCKPLLLCSLLIVPWQIGLAVDWEKRNKEYLEQIVPVLKASCVECHRGSEAEGGLALTNFTSFRSILKERKTWEKIQQRLEIGDMPPRDSKKTLSESDRKRLVDWIKTVVNEVDCGKAPNPGSVTLRRLNRTEYRNTVKDLFGVDYAPAQGFPGDDVGYGFDNIGDVLTLPPLLMEKYIRAAEEISSKVIMAPEPGPVFESIRKPSQFSFEGGAKLEGSRVSIYSNGAASFEEQIPWKGSYSLELGLGGTPASNEYPKLEVSLDGKKVQDISVQTSSAKEVKTFTVSLRIPKAGKRSIKLAFTNDKFIEAKDGKPAEDRNVWIYDVRLVGQKPSNPVPENKLSDVHKEIVKAYPSSSMSVKQAATTVLKPIASRAFRRPITQDEIDRLATLVEEVVDSGESYEAGLQAGLQAILVSPKFLFKVEEPNSTTTNYPLISEFELATRLSYFLWSTSPDVELLQLALKKQLRDPAILRQQVQRMLRSPRSKAMVENFAAQWLTLRKLDQFQPNTVKFPRWNDEIRDLARRETYMFFWHIMQSDQSLMRLLDADYTFLNDKLAKFYEIPGVEGSEFRQVSTKGQKRMGLLTHASVLAVTSNPTRTSPVKRGKWILENLLGTPPPPAPAGVPELEKSELTGTLRQRIEQHRADPACAACHKLMDPVGLALENFDAVGRWRTLDDGQPIDTTGELPNGEQVRGPGDLIRNIRDKNADKFVRCFTEKMMIYALGRGLEYYDRCAIDQILNRVSKEDYKFSSLVFEIVSSDPFQRKGVREEP